MSSGPNQTDGKKDDVVPGMENIDNGGGMLAATSLLQQRANEIRAKRVNWQSYLQGQMITQEDFNFITQFDNSTAEGRVQLLREKSNQCAKTFLNLMGHISKDQTVQYILTMIDDMLQEDKSRVEIFREYTKKRNRDSVWGPFLNMLNRPDGFIVNQTGRIIAKIACWGKDPMEGSDLIYYLTWLKDQMRIPNNEYLQTVARCLQMMLRIDVYRQAFIDVDAITTLIAVLGDKVGFQIQYQLIFCLWCLTFNPKLTDKLSEYNIIPILADILTESIKEKVIRIIVATFHNLLEKSTDKDISQMYALSMVQCKVLKQLDLLEGRKFDDPDITNDMEYLNEYLQASVRDLSSFDEYSTEVKSGRLEWSPVHKTEKFWRECAQRLNEKNYELLKILIKLMESSRDPLILSVAAHDIGEYVRHYPRGKHVIEQLGGKVLVMKMLSHEDPNVRYEALLAVQKIMVHNWEYLSRATGV
ncbi:V-type proton ATPase subunit H-like [Tubulanus polymorphus]|uniref:V-type proton ATPase subunit H-like n=1 Tax=Tubulanus polymorphus TaxID=672921 RepID=UPI003DA6C736